MNLMWNQFRRLLLGTVIEALLEERVPLDFASLSIVFDPDSEFKVPRLDNYMRFKGRVTARLGGTIEEEPRRRLERRLASTWPELLTTLDIPVGDRLASTRNDLFVAVQGDTITIRFDLEAD